MPDIFWKSQNETVILEPKPFKSEDEFEDYLVNNTKILGDIILSKQTRSGTGSDRSDIIGIDNDNNIVLIELKNDNVREDIISQVLRYVYGLKLTLILYNLSGSNAKTSQMNYR